MGTSMLPSCVRMVVSDLNIGLDNKHGKEVLNFYQTRLNQPDLRHQTFPLDLTLGDPSYRNPGRWGCVMQTRRFSLALRLLEDVSVG